MMHRDTWAGDTHIVSRPVHRDTYRDATRVMSTHVSRYYIIYYLLTALSRRRRKVIHVIFACAILTFIKSVSVKPLQVKIYRKLKSPFKN